VLAFAVDPDFLFGFLLNLMAFRRRYCRIFACQVVLFFALGAHFWNVAPGSAGRSGGPAAAGGGS
jgi:hypothetical protein